MDELTVEQEILQREHSRRSSDDSPPELANYRLEQRLGQGSFGTVWAGVQLRTEMAVAVKVLQRPAQGWEGFVREVATLRQVAEHPGVVTLLDADLRHNPPYFVMPWLRRGSLAEAGKSALPQIVEWFRQAAEALRYTHGKGILHCDLKPSNLLLDEENRIRLVDFGQSLMRDAAGHSLGTLGYMPPEQTQADAVPDARWDVYSLGATIYWLIAGKPPRLATGDLISLSSGTVEQRTHLYRQLLSDHPLRALKGIDSDLAAIIQKCLELEPARRTPSVEQILEDLGHRERGQPLLCRRPWSLSYRAAKWLRRPAVVVGLLAGLALSLGGWASWLEIRQKNLQLDGVNQRLQAQSLGLRWEAGVQAESQGRTDLALLRWASLLPDLPQDPGLRMLLGTGNRFPLIWRQAIKVKGGTPFYNATGRMLFSPDGSQLACSLPVDALVNQIEARHSADGRLLWSESGDLRALLPGEDGRWLLTFEGKVQLRKGGAAYNLSGGACLAGWNAKGVEVLQNAGGFVHWSPEDHQLLKGGRIGPGGRPLRAMYGTRFQKGLWDLAQHRRVAYFGPEFEPRDVTPDGRYSLWLAPRGFRLLDNRTMTRVDWPAEVGSEAKVSPDGSRVAVINRHALVCWDTRRRREIWRRPYETPPLSLEFDARSDYLAVGATGSACVLDRHGQTVGGPWPTHLHTSSLQFSPDGQRLALLSSGGQLDLRAVSRPVEWVSDEPAAAVAWHPDGRLTRAHGLTVTLPSGAGAGWSQAVRSGYPVADMALQAGFLDWTSDGRILEVGFVTSQILTSPWDRGVGRYFLDARGVQTYPDSTGRPDEPLEPNFPSPDGQFALSHGGSPRDTGHGIAPPAQTKRTDEGRLVALRTGASAVLLNQALPDGKVYWSDDSRHLAVAGDKSLSFFHLDSAKPLWESAWDKDKVPWVAVAGDGRWVAAARDRLVHLYSRQGKRTDLDPGQAGVAALWFSPDGQFLVVGTPDRRLLVTRLPEDRWFQVGGEELRCLAFHPKRPWIAASGADGVRLYDLISGRPVSVAAPGIKQAVSLAFDADGNRLAMAGAAGVAVWAPIGAGGSAADLMKKLEHDSGSAINEQGQVVSSLRVEPP